MPKGAGSGRPRKPEGTARNVNVPTKGTVFVDEFARVAKIPEPSLPLTGVRADIWNQIWSSPVATLWCDADLASLTRLVILQTTLEAIMNKGLLQEMRQLEDRFLLNPYSRAQQRVVIGASSTTSGGSRDVAWITDARKRLRSTG